MSKSDTLENGILNLIFNGTAIANLAQNNTTAPLTSLFVSLHTADPGEAGTAVTNEATYAGYARVAVSRAGGWSTATGGSVSPAATISFPASTAAGAAITHFGVTSTASGAGVLYYSGTVTPNIAIGAAGITPQLTTGTVLSED